MHELTDIAIVALAALLCGLFMTRAKQPAIVGYILAGVVLGPSGLGLVENREAVSLLAELGVLMLLFVIGMELSLRAFVRVWRIALFGAGSQVLLSLLVMWGLGSVLGWSLELSIALAFGLALSSTAVAIKILEEVGELRTEVGRVAVGILIAQDLAVVPMLLLVNSMSGEATNITRSLLAIGGAVIVLVGMVVLLSRRKSVRLPWEDWMASHADLTPVTGLAICFGAAAISGILGLSPAYGAFLAGLFLGNTRARSKFIEATHPIQAALLMVFFLSVGLLMDLQFIWENIGMVVFLLLLVTLAKTAANIAILRLFREPWPRAFLAGTALGQIGEFSFVLMGAGVASGLIPAEDSRIIVALIALSLMISPVWVLTARRINAVASQGILTLAQFWSQVFGRETRAIVVAAEGAMGRTRAITLSLGNAGLGSWQSLRAIGRASSGRGDKPSSRNDSEPDAEETAGDGGPDDGPEEGASVAEEEQDGDNMASGETAAARDEEAGEKERKPS